MLVPGFHVHRRPRRPAAGRLRMVTRMMLAVRLVLAGAGMLVRVALASRLRAHDSTPARPERPPARPWWSAGIPVDSLSAIAAVAAEMPDMNLWSLHAGHRRHVPVPRIRPPVMRAPQLHVTPVGTGT